MCYALGVLRRILTAALALSLIGLGPVPLSACALFSSKLGECATPQTESQCNKMNTEESGPHFGAAQGQSCCFARAPFPLTQHEASVLSDLSGPPAILGLEAAARPSRDARPAPSNQDLSPPRIQSLLCTFLI